MQRIMIIGGPGSGKSTLARKLHDKLGLPIEHFDRLYWAPGWHERSRDEVNTLARRAADQPSWIIEGNHSSSWGYRAERSDLIIGLFVPRHVRMWRIIKRTLRYYGRSRPDMGEGCPEKFNWFFLRWAWRFDQNVYPRHLAFLAQWQDERRVVQLHSRGEVAKFLAELSAGDAKGE